MNKGEGVKGVNPASSYYSSIKFRFKLINRGRCGVKRIAVLGSSGSIGQSTLLVVRSLPQQFKVEALSVNSDIVKLKQQIKEFKPRLVCVRDEQSARKLRADLSSSIKVFCAEDGLSEMVKDKRIDLAMFAITGSAALKPLLAAIRSNKDIALANKEALVMAGPLVMRLAKKHKVRVLPVDSEQSAIWQSLGGFRQSDVRRVYLTASGGPLRSLPRSKFKRVGLEKILRHPRWKMGRKITVDSATLMNKGLELLEAMFLFNLGVEKIKVLIHPEALIHSMVEFNDGVIMAQLSEADMRIPIQYALTYPQRLVNKFPGIDFYRLKKLHFGKPDLGKFPCLSLAYQAARQLGTMPAVLNAANEVSVNNFLNNRIDFLAIPKIVEKVMRRHTRVVNPDLSDIMAADVWAREEAVCIGG
ncbi:MAG: 1-deoxy-D-xylulose-5-phosphate reductoisomerase [Candidatus Omnitrophica bacterium]|nr:1-deoxy-D-xylulose-5-phosphate reductoisomerase [Candidatus Omnitrophota bacterium]MBU1923550.1 1-deoxy-D-xylulose-5-phosphate reductoisomerase [Candidatus Omnitrophota bacterium]